jgi:hypothetical protein
MKMKKEQHCLDHVEKLHSVIVGRATGGMSEEKASVEIGRAHV